MHYAMPDVLHSVLHSVLHDVMHHAMQAHRLHLGANKPTLQLGKMAFGAKRAVGVLKLKVHSKYIVSTASCYLQCTQVLADYGVLWRYVLWRYVLWRQVLWRHLLWRHLLWRHLLWRQVRVIEEASFVETIRENPAPRLRQIFREEMTKVRVHCYWATNLSSRQDGKAPAPFLKVYNGTGGHQVKVGKIMGNTINPEFWTSFELAAMLPGQAPPHCRDTGGAGS